MAGYDSPLTPRDHHFASCHRAAQAVAAILLGCRVDYLDTATDSVAPDWDMDSIALNDVLTICAAGYQMECVLGRMENIAWDKSQLDRDWMSSIYSEKTGLTLDKTAVNEHFRSGAASSKSILEHHAARQAIDSLSELLADARLDGKERIPGSEVLSVSGLGAKTKDVAVKS